MKSLVVIPTYQEAANITQVIDRVLTAAPLVDILVVDDGSPDGTADLVAAHAGFRDRVFLLRRRAKSGLGAAYRSGYAEALGTGYDAVVQMDADLSHSPEDVPVLLDALARADVVLASRYVAGGRTVGWPRSRRAISAAGNLYARTVLDLPVRDATAGFRAFRTTALATIDVLHSESDGYAFQIETTWRAHQSGLRILEVPITFSERAEGASKMTAGIAVEAATKVLTWRCQSWFGPRGRPWASRVELARQTHRAA